MPTPVFDTYWRFAAERQAIFFRRLRGDPPPLTDDPILAEYRFTNAYRAADRVSQFLIRHVIHDRERTFPETFFRTILFKLFNKVETWRSLEQGFGDVSLDTFSVDAYTKHLESLMRRGDRIYSAAYIMPAADRRKGVRKHLTHLQLLDRMMRDRLPDRIADARTMREAFDLLSEYPMMGKFLAYQYVVDLAYSTHLDFSEMEFVVAGPGALDGIRKCFSEIGEWTPADVIRFMTDTQEYHFERLGLNFESLWGRRLQLIDCQNLFCEVDKYARVHHPEFLGASGRAKIKQRYAPNQESLSYWFPPKWGLNSRIERAT